MQQFIANGRVSDIPEDAVGRTANGNISFKFDFACDSSLQGNDGKPLTSFFHVQVYGKQAESVRCIELSKAGSAASCLQLLVGTRFNPQYRTAKFGDIRQQQYFGARPFALQEPHQIGGFAKLPV